MAKKYQGRSDQKSGEGKGGENMKRKAFFIESKLGVFDYATYDKCGLKIRDVQDGKCFWNPNQNARDRNICKNCYDVFQHKREEGRRLWQDKHNALKADQTFQDYTKPMTKESIEANHVPTVEIERDLLEAGMAIKNCNNELQFFYQENQANSELIRLIEELIGDWKIYCERLNEILEYRKCNT